MHALPTGVLECIEAARPAAVAFVVVGTCFGVRKPTWSAVILAKLLAIGLGASEVIASERISFRYHGEHSPRDLSVRIRGLAIVRVHDFGTLVAAGLVVAWAVWMGVVIRDLLRLRPIRDDKRKQTRAPPRHQRAVSEANERGRIMALARNFDQLRSAVKVHQAQRKQREREQREADEAREHPPVGAADESPPCYQSNGDRGKQSASTSSLPQSALRSASASSGHSTSKRVRILDIVDYRSYVCETAHCPTSSAASRFSSDLQQDAELEEHVDEAEQSAGNAVMMARTAGLTPPDHCDSSDEEGDGKRHISPSRARRLRIVWSRLSKRCAVRAWRAVVLEGRTAARLAELQGRPAQP
jgi:hypothetical protein